MPLLFAATLFLSALLLFVLEPMFARMAIPLLGGSASVWTTCLVFYQGVLLLGYASAHLGARLLGVRRQAILQLGLILLAALLLPIGIPLGWTPPSEGSPIGWLLLLLSVSVGLPFLVLSASAPMLQAWFSRTGHRHAADPYFLYAGSNLGSLAGLLLYPLLIEPALSLRQQSLGWVIGYAVLAVLAAACAYWLLRTTRASGKPTVQPPPELDGPPEPTAGAPALRRRIRWLALSLVPSSLLLGVTTHVSTDLVAVPLLWAIPLALYLLSFVICFARPGPRVHRVTLAVQPLPLLAVACVVFLSATEPSQLAVAMVLHLLAFFLTAMVCHGELAADRPAQEHLTEFYLWLGLGGFLGGVANALLAPLLFSSVLEYPLMLAAAAALRPATPGAVRAWVKVGELVAAVVLLLVFIAVHQLPEWWFGVIGGSGWGARFVDGVLPAWVPYHLRFYRLLLLSLAVLAGWALVRKPLPFAAAVIALLLIGNLCWQSQDRLLRRERTFYGVLRVEEHGDLRRLNHGSTLHGFQSRAPNLRREPLGYYHRKGPFGQLVALVLGRGGREVGVVGLGAGSAAALVTAGSRITFYELDPAVARLANDPELFSYLADCRGEVEIVLGDARLSLQRSRRQFDLLVIDAFLSDSVPVHLLTREAIQLYLARLAPGGILLIHISSRYLRLGSVVGNLAADARLIARLGERNHPSGPIHSIRSSWVALGRREDDLRGLDWPALPADPKHGLWTDDRTSIVPLLEWPSSWSWLQPWTWSDWRRTPPRR